MKTLKLTRREFTRHAGLAILSVSGLASLSTIRCSNDDSPTGPGGGQPGSGLVVNLADYPTLGQVGGVQAINYQNTPIYVFRTGDASFRALSRVCTHKGCTVNWVNSGKKLSCPCHGSEFSDKGSVIKGPARSSLQEFTTQYNADDNTLTIGG